MKQRSGLFTTQSREFLLKTELAKKHSHSTYLASPTNEPDHKVVLTVFTSWLFSLPHEREKLFLKAEGIKKLKHPHLISILDVGIEDEQPFVVREYLPNGSLRSYLKKISPKGLPLRDALNIVSQVGQALVSVHEHQVVHGNIKPENILFDTDGQVRLTVFSLVLRSDVLIRDHIAEEYAFCYTAPEQFGGITDARSDQYALGCLAYELITGQVPFTVQSLSCILGHQSYALPAPLSERVADLPPVLETAVFKAVAKNPAERFQGNFTA
jgi:serine/threonine protein kinase